MNSNRQVNEMVSGWKAAGLSKAEIIVNTAEAELGWPYVWGAVGAECTVAKRKAYAARDVCPSGEADQIYKTCPVLNGDRAGCDGCKWYPNGERVLIDDCQGFVKQIAKRVGITLSGGGATSMWKDNGNWTEKGEIKNMPEKLCCIFWAEGQKMSHVGFYIGGGMMIHCSGTVKKEKLSKKATHYAIPKGLDGTDPEPTPGTDKPTIRRGSTGPYVVECQKDLLQLGYDIGIYGADGKFGAKTEAAVRAFQGDHGLQADGIVGPLTWDALDKAVAPEPEPAEKLYSVVIEHLDKTQATALCRNYPNARMIEEG